MQGEIKTLEAQNISTDFGMIIGDNKLQAWSLPLASKRNMAFVSKR